MARKYAILDGDPVLLGNHEAWSHLAGAWKEISYADAFSKARLMTQDKFETIFGKIEASLPAEAFQHDG